MRVGLITHRELLDQTRQHNISQYLVTDHKMRVNNYTPAVSRHNLHAVELRRDGHLETGKKILCCCHPVRSKTRRQLPKEDIYLLKFVL